MADILYKMQDKTPLTKSLDYALLPDIIAQSDKAGSIQRLYQHLGARLQEAAGSSHNHQAWPGGFLDHTLEVCNIAIQQYAWMKASGRPMNFSLADALLVLLLHDIEKPFRYASAEHDPTLKSKADKKAFRDALISEYDITLTPQQANAQRYAEGIRDTEYSLNARTMSPLAAFVHTCDLLSARMWHNHPTAQSTEEWGPGRQHLDAQDVVVEDETFHADGTVEHK